MTSKKESKGTATGKRKSTVKKQEDPAIKQDSTETTETTGTEDLFSEEIQMIQEESHEGLMPVSATVPKEMVKTKDRVSNMLVDNFLNEGEKVLQMEVRQSAKPITTKVTFSYEGVDIFAKQEFTSFDREVHDAVVSLMLAGNKVIAPSMVYRTMAGKTKSEYVTHEKIEEISRSIDKCMFSKIVIDASEEAKVYENFESAQFSGNLISAEKMQVIINGQKVEAYKLLNPPILYRYATSKKQIAKIPMVLLDTPLNKTTEVIILQGYLLRRIEAMRSPRVSNIILYETIYKALGAENASRQKKSNIRENVRVILQYWIEQNYIQSYVENNKGKMKYSISISLSRRGELTAGKTM